MLAEEALGIGDSSNLQRIEGHKRFGGVVFVVVVIVFVKDGQARKRPHELVALVAAIVGDGRLGRVEILGPGLGEQGRVLVGLFGRAAILFVPGRRTVRALVWVWNLVEAVIDDLALREVGEKAPGDDLGGVGACFVDALVLGGRAVVPLERPGDDWRSAHVLWEIN